MSMMVELSHAQSEKLSADDIIVSTRQVIQGLEALKNENNSILQTLQGGAAAPGRREGEGEKEEEDEHKGLVEEKSCMVQKSLEMIELGLEEAQVMMALSAHLSTLEAEKQKLRAQVKRLCQENQWLRDELASTQQKLQRSEQMAVQLEEEKKQLEFINQLKKYEQQDPPDEEENRRSKDTLDDLFPGEEEEQIQMSRQGSSAAVVAQQGGYEIPARLRTLHNLVIQYASQGRYEVAVPLCKQALEDLEKTSGHSHPDVATMLNILALVYRDQNKYKEAANLLNDALAIREKTLGIDHPAVAATLNNLAVLYGKRGKYKEAEPLCKRALEIREKVQTSRGRDRIESVKSITIITPTTKTEERASQEQRFWAVSCASLPPPHPPSLYSWAPLASCYLKQGKYRQAEALYKEILTRAHEREFCSVDGENRPIWIHTDGSDHTKEKLQVSKPCDHRHQRRERLLSALHHLKTCPCSSCRTTVLGGTSTKRGDWGRGGQGKRMRRQRPPLRSRLGSPRREVKRRIARCVCGDALGNLRRSGSFTKLRDSIRRSSERLVRKLRGAGPQEAAPRSLGMKRANSLNVLNVGGKTAADSSQKACSSLTEARSLSSSTQSLTRRSSLTG
uniref:Kinesin light chain n=1 Tax=Latimeria chalumnae TaxID=7897 RepID=H3B340_LATCH